MKMPASLFYRTEGYFVGDIPFDLEISENHTIEASVTEHPVEDGSIVSDHVRVLPRKGSIVGLVTNHPLPSARIPSPGNKLPGEFMERVSQIGNPGFFKSLAMQYSREITDPITDKDFASLTPLNPGTDNRARNAWELFKELVAAKQPVTIMTGVEKYADVIVTKVSTSREAGTGDALRFAVEFQEIRFVTLTEVEITSATKAPLPSIPVAKSSKGKVGGKQVRMDKKPTVSFNGQVTTARITQ